MLRVSLTDLNQEERLILLYFLTKDGRSNWWFNHVGANFGQELLEGIHLLARHALDIATVGYTTQHHPTICVSKSGKFIRQIVTTGTLGIVSCEHNFLEFPVTVFA